jgi:NAD(P)-dependent dehydrogenase (short-subunit alcohol dehydrogenase family)
MRTALVTGGSAGLGLALTRALAARGTTVITDGRSADALARIDAPGVRAVPGDVADHAHRAALVREVDAAGGLDLLVHNASTLGPLPLRPVRELSAADLRALWEVNVAAPVELTRALLPALHAVDGVVVSVTSDAAVEHYPTWGGYAATKVALEHLTLTLAAEEGLTAYAVDPGDMRTRMQQDAFPGEDISDRPEPETVVPAILALLDQRPPSGRHRAADIAVTVGTEAR